MSIGVVLSEDPLNYDACWRCENYPNNCEFQPVSCEMIKEMEDAADAEIMKGPKQKTGNEEGK